MPTISFKVTADEARALRRKVRAEKTSLSDYLRRVALPPAAPPRKRLLKRHPASGAIYDATPGPVVTEAQIREALAEFP